MENRRFSKGGLIFIQGEPDNKLYKLNKGKVVIYLAFQSMLMLDIVVEPQFIGFAPLTGNVHKFTAEVIEDAEIIVYDEFSEKTLFNEHTLLMNQLIGKVDKRLNQEDIQGKTNLVSQIEKLESINEGFLARFFPYKLVRDVLRELTETGQIKRIERGKYQKVKESFALEEGW
ncbi:MAG TPA: cyclic nucleotide-binding domain-containing protein [Thermotogota bacterium]|nr:cyclic nucleotide-binding domain-containing protein [Thermotogota bacterium]HPJ87646.1 cyclic nucleotide-binding domain-containing protein [Thermotogota bacterium]HPR94916.1 cyclic nucleotide-binding domain-containing protein [Thermotogota bacterium]